MDGWLGREVGRQDAGVSGSVCAILKGEIIMSELIVVPAHEVTPALRALFAEDQPLALRCFAVLDGSIRGRIWADDPIRPTWGAVQEWAWGTLFFGGNPPAELVHALIAKLQREGGVELALWPDHPYNQLLPPHPDEDAWELAFTNRPLGTDPVPGLVVPAGCELVPIDATWFERCRYRDAYLGYFGTAERALAQGFGFCLVKGAELLCEAFAGESALGLIEIGVITGEACQRRGYATLCCARCIREAETRGYRTYWCCDKANLGSAALARKLGYQTEREYRFVHWGAPERSTTS